MMRDFSKVKHHSWVRMITGDQFDLATVTVKTDQIPSSNEFVVYDFENFMDDDGGFKIYQCKYEGGCHRTIPNPSKFMDHMRSHTKDRPFLCRHEGCGKAFSQRTNLV